MKKLESRWDTFAAVPDFKRLRIVAFSPSGMTTIMGKRCRSGVSEKKPSPKSYSLISLVSPRDRTGAKTPGIYDSVTFEVLRENGVQFVLLDTRYFRSPLKRAHKREQEKVPTSRTTRKKPSFWAKGNGNGWRKLFANQRTFVSSHRAFR